MESREARATTGEASSAADVAAPPPFDAVKTFDFRLGMLCEV